MPHHQQRLFMVKCHEEAGTPENITGTHGAQNPKRWATAQEHDIYSLLYTLLHGTLIVRLK